MMTISTNFLSRIQNKNRLLFVLHFISIALLYLPNGTGWYFGNLVVYINSYWYATQSATSFSTQWVISTFVVFWSGSLIFGGKLISKIDRRVLTLIGVLFFDAGLYLGQVSIEQSQIVFIITYAVLSGIGIGLIQSEVLTRIPALVTGRTGLAFAVINNCYNVGAIFYQWVATWYVNPNNEEADTPVLGKYKVFREKDVIDRVPYIFIVLGIITSILHVSGFIMTMVLGNKGLLLLNSGSGGMSDMKEKTELKESTSLTNDESSNKYILGKTENQTVVIESGLSGSPSKKDSEEGENLRNWCESYSSEETKPIWDTDKGSELIKCCDSIDSSKEGKSFGKRKNLDSNCQDMTPLEMLKTLRFYVMWYGMMANDVVYIVLLNYYKLYGEIYIHDDHFLTYLGMVSLISVLFARFILAWVIDTCSVKTTNTILSSIMTLGFVFFFFSPQINRWLFAGCTCLLMGLCSGVYLVFPVSLLKLFGRTHFAANYGLLVTSTIVLNILAPFTLNMILTHLGWAGLFFGTACVSLVSLIVNFLGLPNKS